MLLLLGGLAFPGCKGPMPPPPVHETPEPDPEPAPWQKPVRSTALKIQVDEKGGVLVNGKRRAVLSTALLTLSEGQNTDAGVRIQVDGDAPWYTAERVLQACSRVGLRNLHWQVLGEGPPSYWPLPADPGRKRLLRSQVTLHWDSAAKQASYSWRSLPRGRANKGLSLLRAVNLVRAHRSRRVVMRIASDTPFRTVHEAVDGIRFSGVTVVFTRSFE